MTTGKLFIVSGTTGAGKNTILKEYLNITTHTFTRVITYTTREARENEVNGVDYHFVSDAEFDDLIKQNFFLEWAHVHSNRYGTPRPRVEEILKKSENVFLQIDVQGALTIKKQKPETVLIFVKTESMDIIRKRYIKRQGALDPDFEVRLQSAEKELPLADQYNYQIINKEDKIEEAVQDLQRIVDKELMQE